MKGAWAAVILVLLGGCNGWNMFKPGAAANPPPVPGTIGESEGWVPTGNDDLDTIAICLIDFMKQGRMTSLVDGQRSTIVVNNMTNGAGEASSDAQIANETRRLDVPPGVITSLQARNQAPQEVTWIPPGLPFFVSDLSTLPEDLGEMATQMPKVYPKSFAAVWLWLPGYSDDGAWAMVRFTFAPTSNGAIATYLLVKDETGKWRINNRRLTYLMAVAP